MSNYMVTIIVYKDSVIVSSNQKKIYEFLRNEEISSFRVSFNSCGIILDNKHGIGEQFINDETVNTLNLMVGSAGQNIREYPIESQLASCIIENLSKESHQFVLFKDMTK